MTPSPGNRETNRVDCESPPLIHRLGRRTFRSLRHRDFRLYFFGQVVSFVGSWMQSTALMWLAYDLTADSLWPALMIVASVGPTLLLGPLAGALADRLPKRFLVLATQATFLVNAVLLAIVVALNIASPWTLLGLQLVNGLVNAVDLPARLSFVPDLVPKDDLINAVSLNAMAFNGARFLGPAFAGQIYLLIGSTPQTARIGAAICFALNAMSYAAVLLALTRISIGGLRPASSASTSIFDGLRFLVAERSLGLLLILTSLLCVFTWPVLSLLPAFTRTVIGHDEKSFSLLVSSLGAGACLAAAMTATFGTIRRRRLFLGAGATMGSFGVLGLSQAQSPMTAAACCMLLGIGLVTYLSTGQSTMQLRSPDAIRGRVMAYWAMTLSVSAPVGHLISGSAAQVWSVPQVLEVMGGGAILTAAMIVILVSQKGLKR
jgi:MFS family permease